VRFILAALVMIAALGAGKGPAAADEPSVPPPAAAAPQRDQERVVLYDPAAGTLPAAQGWLYLTRPLVAPAAQQKLSGTTLILDTTAMSSDSAGYFAMSHPRMPILDRTRGYQLRLVLRVDREAHASPRRAGFSWLVLGDDGRGIELGFWTNEIWAQSGPDFRHAEGTSFDTTARSTLYELRVAGDEYALQAAGRKILGGPLRSYAQHWHPIYRATNVVFVGDDTQSAAARVELGAIEIRGGRKPGDR